MKTRYIVLPVCLALIAGLAVTSPLAAQETKQKKQTKEKTDKKSETKAEQTTEVKVDDITLQIPKSWKKEKPSNRLRKAQFKIPAAKGDKQGAEMVVSFFGGSGGGVQANIQRWASQFQGTGKKIKVSTGKSPQGLYVVTDIKGTYNQSVGPPILRQTKPLPNARMISIILEIENKGSYFLKLTGPEKTVTKALPGLRKAFAADKDKEKAFKIND